MLNLSPKNRSCDCDLREQQWDHAEAARELPAAKVRAMIEEERLQAVQAKAATQREIAGDSAAKALQLQERAAMMSAMHPEQAAASQHLADEYVVLFAHPVTEVPDLKAYRGTYQ